MKSIVIASVSLFVIFAFVISSACITQSALTSLSDAVGEADGVLEFEKIYNDFRRLSRYLSLTLPDSELSEIEYSILEVRAYLYHGTNDEADAAKSRLESKINEARRLSGLNPRSIF